MQTTAEFTGPLLPDLPDRGNAGVSRADNCLPLSNSYEPFRSHVVDTDPLPSPCIGTKTLQDYGLNAYNYAGTVADVYSRTGNTWTSIGTGYTASGWEFESFNDRAYAAGGVPLQSGIHGGALGSIASAPSPLHIGISRNFVISANMPLFPRRVQWSALGDGEVWVSDGTNQAGQQELQRGGAISKVIGGEYAVIFCEHSIYVMRYVGGGIIWQFDEVQPGRGAISGGSVVQRGNDIYYLDVDGFWVFNGIQSQTLGTAKMNQTFVEDYDDTKPEAVSSLIDLDNTLVYWAYPGSGNTGIANKIMVYNYATDRWAGPVFVQVQRLSYSSLPAVLSDNLAGLSDSFDTLSDAQEYRGGSPRVSAFNELSIHGNYVGQPLEALVESGEFAINVGGKALIRSVRALVDGPSPNVTVSLGTRNSASGPVTYTTDKVAYLETGKAKFRSNARFHRIRVKVSGNFTHILGAEPEATATSNR